MTKREYFIQNLQTAKKYQETMSKRGLRVLDDINNERTYHTMGEHKDIILHVRENQYGNRIVTQVQFKTIGCRMKKAGSCFNCNYGVCTRCTTTREQYIAEFKNKLNQLKGDVLVLESLGSITDPAEFDEDTFKEIIKVAIKEGKFQRILIETHLTHIPEELVKYISKIDNPNKRQVGFEVGIEDTNPKDRKLINKIGVRNEQLQQVYNMLEKYGMSLGINLIYGFPFMSEQERINAVVDSIKYIHENLPEAGIVLFLMSIKDNTIMKLMKDKGFYIPANPWGLVEVLEQIVSDEKMEDLILTLSWFGEKEDPYIHEETCYNCNKCKSKIIECFRQINNTYILKFRKELLDKLVAEQELKCGCYKEFLQQLQKSDGKTPEIRYEEFMRYIHKLARQELADIRKESVRKIAANQERE